MSLPITTVASIMITDIHNDETQSISFWSDVEKIVKHTGEIAAAVFMTRINTLKCHSKDKVALDRSKAEFISYLKQISA